MHVNGVPHVPATALQAPRRRNGMGGNGDPTWAMADRSTLDWGSLRQRVPENLQAIVAHLGTEGYHLNGRSHRGPKLDGPVAADGTFSLSPTPNLWLGQCSLPGPGFGSHPQ